MRENLKNGAASARRKFTGIRGCLDAGRLPQRSRGSAFLRKRRKRRVDEAQAGVPTLCLRFQRMIHFKDLPGKPPGIKVVHEGIGVELLEIPNSGSQPRSRCELSCSNHCRNPCSVADCLTFYFVKVGARPTFWFGPKLSEIPTLPQTSENSKFLKSPISNPFSRA